MNIRASSRDVALSNHRSEMKWIELQIECWALGFDNDDDDDDGDERDVDGVRKTISVCSLVIWSREERNNFVKSNFHVYLRRTMKKWMKNKYNGEKIVYFLVNINKYNEIMIECRVYTFRTDWKLRIEWVWMNEMRMNESRGMKWYRMEWMRWSKLDRRTNVAYLHMEEMEGMKPNEHMDV